MLSATVLNGYHVRIGVGAVRRAIGILGLTSLAACMNAAPPPLPPISASALAYPSDQNVVDAAAPRGRAVAPEAPKAKPVDTYREALHEPWNPAEPSVLLPRFRRDPNSDNGFYIPRDLDDAVTELVAALGPAFAKFHRGMKPDDKRWLANFGEGMGGGGRGLEYMIATTWDLWPMKGGSRLSEWMLALGVDDSTYMAEMIADAYLSFISCRQYNLNKAVEKYRKLPPHPHRRPVKKTSSGQE